MTGQTVFDRFVQDLEDAFMGIEKDFSAIGGEREVNDSKKSRNRRGAESDFSGVVEGNQQYSGRSQETFQKCDLTTDDSVQLMEPQNPLKMLTTHMKRHRKNVK